jgi:hypothetical protein
MNWKKIDIKGILEGAYNSIFIKRWVESVAKDRIKVCNNCPFQSENATKEGYVTHRPDVHCTDCGCNLHMKTRCMDCECPKQLWLKVMEDEQWEELKQKHKL